MRRPVRVAVSLLPLLLLGACMDASAPVVTPNDAVLASVAEAPLMAVQAAAGAPIPGQYIVVMKATRAARAASAAAAVGVSGDKVKRTFHSALDGFTATLSDGEAAALSRDPNVALVERDQVFTISTTQSPATWGIDRIDQRARPLSNSYTYTRTGAGVRAYIIDTGIRFSHSEFGGRAVSGFDAVDGGAVAACPARQHAARRLLLVIGPHARGLDLPALRGAQIGRELDGVIAPDAAHVAPVIGPRHAALADLELHVVGEIAEELLLRLGERGVAAGPEGRVGRGRRRRWRGGEGGVAARDGGGGEGDEEDRGAHAYPMIPLRVDAPSRDPITARA